MRPIATLFKIIWKLKILIGLFVLGGWGRMIALWETFKSGIGQLPTAEWWFIWILIVLTGLYVLCVLIIVFWAGRPDSFEGYRDRDFLRWSRGSLENELKKAKKTIWIYWDTGAMAQHESYLQNESIRNKIEKMIIMDPSHPSIKEMPRYDKTVSEQLITELISRTEKQALIAGIDMRRLANPIHLPSMIMIDHHSYWKGWIRFDVMWPGMQPNDRPSIVIKRRQYRKLFKNIKESYLAVFHSLPKLK